MVIYIIRTHTSMCNRTPIHITWDHNSSCQLIGSIPISCRKKKYKEKRKKEKSKRMGHLYAPFINIENNDWLDM